MGVITDHDKNRNISERPPCPRAILWISILLALLYVYQLNSEFGLLRYMFTNNSARWDLAQAMYFIRPLIIMPVAAVLFILRKRSGWVLVCAYFIYLFINTITLLYFPDNKIDRLVPATPADLMFGWLVFICGCLYFMLKTDVRNFYNIHWRNVIVALILGVLLSATTII